MALNDCGTATNIVIDESYTVPGMSVVAGLQANGGIRLPVLAFTWTAIDSTYITGVEIEYQPFDGSTALRPITTEVGNPQDLGRVINNVVAGKSIKYRYRAVGEYAVGNWSTLTTISIPSISVNGPDLRVDNGAGVLINPFSVVNDVVSIRADLISRLPAGAFVVVNGSGGTYVALQPFQISITDGVPVTWNDLGVPPTFGPIDPFPLAPLSSGETYSNSMTAVTRYGATPKLRKNTPGGITSHSQGPTAGSANIVTVSKVDSPDAYNNIYRCRVQGYVTGYTNTDSGGGGGGKKGKTPPEPTTTYDGGANISFYFYTGGGYVLVGTGFIYPVNYTGVAHAYDQYFDFTFSSAMGSGGSFKAQMTSSYSGADTLDQMTVSWQSNGASGDVTASPNGESTLVMVYPANVPVV